MSFRHHHHRNRLHVNKSLWLHVYYFGGFLLMFQLTMHLTPGAPHAATGNHEVLTQRTLQNISQIHIFQAFHWLLEYVSCCHTLIPYLLRMEDLVEKATGGTKQGMPQAFSVLWQKSKYAHKVKVRSNHIRVDSRTLQICLKLSKRGRGHTRNHSNLENTHSFKILKRVLNINYLSQFHTYRWLHPQSNHTVQCSIQPGRFEPFDSKIRPKRFLCGNSIHPFICHLFVEIFFFQFSNFPSISDRKNVNLPPDSFNSCFSTSR